MNILQKLDKKLFGPAVKWIEKRKEDKYDQYKLKRPWNKSKKDLVRRLCDSCGNNKMWYKNGKYKCTSCGHKIEL